MGTKASLYDQNRTVHEIFMPDIPDSLMHSIYPFIPSVRISASLSKQTTELTPARTMLLTSEVLFCCYICMYYIVQM